VTFPRKPDAAEWSDLKGDFPSLSFDDVWITAPIDPQYNCLAWTLGITDRWVWPWSVPMVGSGQFSELYRQFGLYIGAPAKVVAWGQTLRDMTHGSIRYAGNLGVPDLWESKLGASWRITHSLDGLKGRLYGSTLLYYAAPSQGVNEVQKHDKPMAALTPEEEAKVREKAANVSADARLAFEVAFSAWEQSWRRGEVIFSSNPETLKTVPEFRVLLVMGSPIIPLVVEKLTHPKNFFALQLYDELQGRYEGARGREAVVSYTPSDPYILEGEQGRCVRTIRRWLAVNQVL